MNFKTIAIIPARLNSTRVPNKILYPFHGLPMIEHIRRRAKLCKGIDDVFVATCDNEIANVVNTYGGHYIMTSSNHKNGTERIIEAASKLENTDFSHIMLIQGDEPLILPSQLEFAVQMVSNNFHVKAWNATGLLTHETDIKNESIVKCAVSYQDRINLFFRKSPSNKSFIIQQKYIRQIIGLMCFNKEMLMSYNKLREGIFEKHESIEQSRFIENGFEIRSIPLEKSYPSLNVKDDLSKINKILESDKLQNQILHNIL